MPPFRVVLQAVHQIDQPSPHIESLVGQIYASSVDLSVASIEVTMATKEYVHVWLQKLLDRVQPVRPGLASRLCIGYILG